MEAKYHKLNSDIHKFRNTVFRPWLPQAVVFLSGIFVLLLHIPLSVFPLGVDQGIWATAGMALARGKVFYLDFLHFHLPGLGFAYQVAFLFTDDPRVASAIVSAVGSLAIVVGLYMLLSETISRSAGAWAAVLFAVLFPTSLGYLEIAEKDFMTIPGILLATWLAVHSGTERSVRRRVFLFASGVMVGCACMFKPVVVIAGPLLAVGLAMRFVLSQRHADSTKNLFTRLQPLLIDLSTLTSGALVVALGFIIYLAVHHALFDAWVSIFSVAYHYGITNNVSLMSMVWGLYNYTLLIGQDNYAVGYLLLLVGCAAMIAPGFSGKRMWLLIPLVTFAISFIIQRKGLPYQAVPWQVMLFLLVGSGAAWIWKDRSGNDAKPWGALSFSSALLYTSIVGVLLYQSLFLSPWNHVTTPAWQGRISRHDYLSKYISHNPDSASPLVIETLAETIRDTTGNEDRILVWGLECQFYVLADRMYSTNTPFDYLLTNESVTLNAYQWQKEKRHEFLSMLHLQPPVYIIVTTNDATRVEPIASDQAIAFIPGFQQFIDQNYTLINVVEHFKIYKLNHRDTE